MGQSRTIKHRTSNEEANSSTKVFLHFSQIHSSSLLSTPAFAYNAPPPLAPRDTLTLTPSHSDQALLQHCARAPFQSQNTSLYKTSRQDLLPAPVDTQHIPTDRAKTHSLRAAPMTGGCSTEARYARVVQHRILSQHFLIIDCEPMQSHRVVGVTITTDSF